MDADFVLMSLEPFISPDMSTHDGRPGLSNGESIRVKETMSHWVREIADFVEAGKTVFVVLGEYQEVYTQTGERISNYDLLPISLNVTQSNGVSMILSPSENPLREYWGHCGNDSEYRVYLESADSWDPLVTTRTGNKLLGGIFRHRSDGVGALVALPWLDIRMDDPLDEFGEWLPKARGWGKQFVKILSSLDVLGQESTSGYSDSRLGNG